MNISLRQIATISRITIKENVRNKSFAVLILTGVVLFVFSNVLGTMTIGEKNRVIMNSGFWIIGMWGLITTVFLGIASIQREIQKKTVYMIFSRPVERYVFILGKFCGILIVMMMVNSVLSLVFIIQLSLAGEVISLKLCLALVSIFLEWVVLAGFSLFFSVFTSPLLHGFFLSSIYFMGHWSNYLYAFAYNTENLFYKYVLIVMYNGFPNLEALNYRTLALYDETIQPLLFLQSACTSVGWTATTLTAAILLFNQRRFP